MESHWRDCQFWDSSIPGWASSYVVAGICIVCAILAGMGQVTLPSQLFLIFACATCLAFGLGGAAFMMLHMSPGVDFAYSMIYYVYSSSAKLFDGQKRGMSRAAMTGAG
ncbi:unnamed protein product [Symbiodinium natans]|uniref:Uncharacterized protein n=1 Tax=Symbiodinium natans TaxID=878477 RepID=A0A812L967_9DINO|nr:unnamed protein product [Symbiodinium natans]